MGIGPTYKGNKVAETEQTGKDIVECTSVPGADAADRGIVQCAGRIGKNQRNFHYVGKWAGC